MVTKAFLDRVYSRADVGDMAYKRLEVTCEAAGLELYNFIAPYQIVGTGKVYVVVSPGSSGWARDDWHKGVQHPILILNIFSDDSRDEDGNTLRHDARNKALAVFDFLNPFLDGITSKDWPEIVSSRRDGEPQTIDVPDGHGAILLHTRYEVSHG